MAEKPVHRSPSGPPASPRLVPRVLLLVALVAVVAAGAVAGYAEWRIRSQGTGVATLEVDAAARAQRAADAQRLEAVALAASRLARDPDLRSALGAAPPVPPESEAEPPSVVPVLEDALDGNRLELALVVPQAEGGAPVQAPADAAGQPPAPESLAPIRAGGPEEAATALAGSPLVELARDEGRVHAAWSHGGRLYLAAAERVVEDFEALGVVAVADLVGRAAAVEARALGRAEAAYLVAGDGGAPTVVASTLGRDAAADLLPRLQEAGVLDRVLRAGERVDAVELRLGGASYRLTVAPLEGPAGEIVGARVTAVAAGLAATLLRTVQWVAAAGCLAALLLGAIGAILVARGSGATGREVEAAAESARAGDLAGAGRHAIPPTLAAFFAAAAEERALEEVVAAAAREDAGPGGEGDAERRRGAVLVVEMPRYARLGPDDEARDVAGRLARDLDRVRRAAGARGGRVEASLGHRVLAVFEGDRASARALGAGAEVLRSLSEPENAFDEPVPPALALASGEVVVAGSEGGRTVTGLPVQQSESLLREASSGDLILSRGVQREIEAPLREGGVELRSQRGLLTPQPVFLLGADRAARAATVLGFLEAGAGSTAPELSSLGPGAVLADRFVLVRPRAIGPVSVDFVARDRETDALVALTALRRDVVLDLDALEGLDSEVRGLLRVAHPALARMVGLGVSGGVPYVAGELVEGPTLERVLGHRSFLPGPAALRLARGVAEGLGALHGAGFAHGGLRPAVVVLDPRGRARLGEVGLALVLPPPGTDAAMDRALGSPRYLAPERLAGSLPDPPADVYSAGALLFEAFTGRPLYGPASGDGQGPAAWDELRERIAAGPPEPPDPTELPDGLAPVLERCLARNPAGRFPDGGALARALEPIRAELIRPT